MFGLNRLFGNTKTQAQTASKPRAAALDLELLEGRTMPATTNYLVLDFTPDSHAGSFRDTFYNTKLANGYAPGFLDFNKDGRITDADVSIAATQVANRVATFFSPFVNNAANRLNIIYGDVLSNTNYGTRWINYGRYYSNIQVEVMYIGGTNRGGSSILGIAPTPGNGYNVEGFGETYSRTAANYLKSINPNGSSATFVNIVAATATHELGHMLGLQHSTSGDVNNVMAAIQSRNPGATYFVAGNVNTTTGYQQNAYRELDASFQSNQIQIGGSINSGQFQHTDEHGCDMDHGDHEGETDHSDEVAYGFDLKGTGDVGHSQTDAADTNTQTSQYVSPVTPPTHANVVTQQDFGGYFLGSGESQHDAGFGLDRWNVALDR